MAKGFIYILTNPVMPGLIKIGLTEQDDVRERRNQLYRGSTGVPVPFEFYYVAEVPNVAKVEKALHEGFAEHRINNKREFFRMHPERVIAMLQMVDPKPVNLERIDQIVTEEDKEEAEVVKTTKPIAPPFRFSMVGISIGEVLTFIRDPSIVCTVVSDREIEYQGEITYLSPLAQKLLGWKYSVQGPSFWLYNGKLLSELRLEKEKELFGEE